MQGRLWAPLLGAADFVKVTFFWTECHSFSDQTANLRLWVWKCPNAIFQVLPLQWTIMRTIRKLRRSGNISLLKSLHFHPQINPQVTNKPRTTTLFSVKMIFDNSTQKIKKHILMTPMTLGKIFCGPTLLWP